MGVLLRAIYIYIYIYIIYIYIYTLAGHRVAALGGVDPMVPVVVDLVIV